MYLNGEDTNYSFISDVLNKNNNYDDSDDNDTDKKIVYILSTMQSSIEKLKFLSDNTIRKKYGNNHSI